MKNRIIENWLNNATELVYQVPFTQLLLSQGHKIIHITRHGPFEQGKDLITVAADGIPCGYQLKGGNITESKWKSEVRDEVIKLVEIPLKHPSLAEGKPHRSYLVTNGYLSEEVRLEIDDRNKDWVKRGYQPLQTIVIGELVEQFIEHYGDFIPGDIQDLSVFLKILMEDGRLPLNKQALVKLLEEILPINENPASCVKSKVEQSINAATVITSYVLENKVLATNHIAIIEAWILLLSYIFLVVEKLELESKYWEQTVEIIYAAIDKQFVLLCEEIKTRSHYVEGNAPLEDVFVYKTRITIVSGFLAGFGIHLCIRNKFEEYKECIDIINTFLDETIKYARFTGECAAPYLTNIALFRELTGKKDLGSSLLSAMINKILVENEHPKSAGIPDPYHDNEEVIEWLLNINKKTKYETFKGQSYSIKALVLLHAQRDLKEYIEANWESISEIQYAEYLPDSLWSYMKYENRETGDFNTRFFKQKQSWKEIKDESLKDYSEYIPKILTQKADFIPLWLNVYPQRFIPNIVLYLSNILKNS